MKKKQISINPTYNKRARNGICVKCGEAPAMKNSRTCLECGNKEARRVREYYHWNRYGHLGNMSTHV